MAARAPEHRHGRTYIASGGMVGSEALAERNNVSPRRQIFDDRLSTNNSRMWKLLRIWGRRLAGFSGILHRTTRRIRRSLRAFQQDLLSFLWSNPEEPLFEKPKPPVSRCRTEQGIVEAKAA